MKSVESGGNEEDRTIQIVTSREFHSYAVLEVLANEEGDSQNNGEEKVSSKFVDTSFYKRSVRYGNRDARGKEKNRVEKGESERIQFLRSFRKSAISYCDGGNNAVMKEGSEESEEEHHFRDNEKDNTHAKAMLHFTSVVSSSRLFYNGDESAHDGSEKT